MRPFILRPCLSGVLLCLFALANGQRILSPEQRQAIVDRNNRYIDSVDQTLQLRCDNKLSYPDHYNQRWLKQDRPMLDLVDAFFLDEGMTLPKFEIALARLKLPTISARYKQYTGYSKEERKNGSITYTVFFLRGRYLRADLKIESIDGVVLHKLCRLETNEVYGHCPSGPRLPDLHLMRTDWTSHLHFPLRFFDDEYMLAEEKCTVR